MIDSAPKVSFDSTSAFELECWVRIQMRQFVVVVVSLDQTLGVVSCEPALYVVADQGHEARLENNGDGSIIDEKRRGRFVGDYPSLVNAILRFPSQESKHEQLSVAGIDLYESVRNERSHINFVGIMLLCLFFYSKAQVIRLILTYGR